jgi:hypothetical protein
MMCLVQGHSYSEGAETGSPQYSTSGHSTSPWILLISLMAAFCPVKNPQSTFKTQATPYQLPDIWSIMH